MSALELAAIAGVAVATVVVASLLWVTDRISWSGSSHAEAFVAAARALFSRHSGGHTKSVGNRLGLTVREPR